MQMKFSDGQSEFSRVFNFAILGYTQNSRKLDAIARKNIVFYSSYKDITNGEIRQKTLRTCLINRIRQS